MSKGIYQIIGFLFLGLALLGVLLPLLPTTPFLLVSAWCFARSSEKWHQKLLNSQLFGPMIKNWETNRCVTRRTKFVAIASMLIVGGGSMFLTLEQLELRLLTAGLLLVGAGVVLSLNTCQCEET